MIVDPAIVPAAVVGVIILHAIFIAYYVCVTFLMLRNFKVLCIVFAAIFFKQVNLESTHFITMTAS